MEFEWNEEKAEANLNKHEVSFEEARTVFEDPLFLIFGDPDHSIEENRFIIMGESNENRLLIVSFTQRELAIRLISARRATRPERKKYEEEV